jgi:hypothetical protein
MRAPQSASALALVLLVGACTDVQLGLIGARRPARPEGCAVDLRPSERALPEGEFTDVAAGTVSCFDDRPRCLEQVRKQACAVGADTVYAFTESEGGGFTNIEARYAARQRPSTDAVSGAR